MEYKLIRSKRKTIELSIGDDFIPLVKAPIKMSIEDIEKFVSKHEKWIEKHVLKKREHDKKFVLTDDEISALKAKALPYMTERTEYFAKIMGVEPTGIKITSAEKRFGSCSAKNSICYSWRLMQYPQEAIDYVVVHELSHIVYKNHGVNFYKFIKKILPDYKKRENMLKI